MQNSLIINTYGLWDFLNDEIIERLEALRRNVTLVFHLINLEVDQACVG